MQLLAARTADSLIRVKSGRPDCCQAFTMRLRRFTDYALRVLLYLGARPDDLCSMPEVAAAHGVSEHHLEKVVTRLGRLGYVETVRGRSGGVRLARPAEAIAVGEVVRRLEGEAAVVDCEGCILAGRCGLACALDGALQAFYARLDVVSLRDLLGPGPADAATRKVVEGGL